MTSSLGGGGAERVLLTMAEYWANAGHQVTVVTLRAASEREYPVPENVRVERVNLIEEKNPVGDPRHLFRLAKLRARIVGLKPTIVISFIDKLNVAVLMALVGTGIPVVATEHLAPWMNPLGRAWEALRRATYPLARAVVSPTQAITSWFEKHLRGRFETLPYPAVSHGPLSWSAMREKVILGVGRLSHQKGFDLLIDAFASLAPRCPDWRVEIAGEGPLRTELESQILAHGLKDQVILLGHVSDVGALYRRSEIFALPSRHEAYPMVLCEAIFAGCAIVAFDCSTGPREILGKPPAGILLPSGNIELIEKALRELVESPQTREALGKASLRRAPDLELSKVMLGWDKMLFQTVLNDRY